MAISHILNSWASGELECADLKSVMWFLHITSPVLSKFELYACPTCLACCLGTLTPNTTIICAHGVGTWKIMWALPSTHSTISTLHVTDAQQSLKVHANSMCNWVSAQPSCSWLQLHRCQTAMRWKILPEVLQSWLKFPTVLIFNLSEFHPAVPYKMNKTGYAVCWFWTSDLCCYSLQC